jgi:hypothetical protein
MSTDLFHSHDRSTGSVTTHEHLGFELGWDFAHYDVHLPAPYANEPSPLRNGLLAGAATFGRRTLQPTRHTRKWLQLRLHAWLRGRSVELVQVTPHYLQQIDVVHCPVTRVALSHATLEGSDASIDRVRSDAGYAAGNLAVMCTKANHAKAAHGFRDAQAFAQRIAADGLGGIAGLTAVQWERTAILWSYVEPLSHAEACALPMLVLPPNRLRLFNPVQALQAFVSLQLATPGWSHRLSRFEELLPDALTRRAFQRFFHTLLPRVLEAGGRAAEPHAIRWAIEDAWRAPQVLERWTAFARRLGEAQCEELVARASQRKLGTTRLDRVTDEQAVDGWNLDSRGYVPHGVLTRRRVAHPRAAEARPPARMPRQAHLPLQ